MLFVEESPVSLVPQVRKFTYQEVIKLMTEVVDDIREGMSEERRNYLELLGYFFGISSSLVHQLYHVELINIPEAREEFREVMIQNVLQSFTFPGYSAGITAVDAVFRDFMQSALSSPHLTGQKIELGTIIDRLIEIFSTRRSKAVKYCSTFVSFYKKASLREILGSYKHKFLRVTLYDMILDYQIISPEQNVDISWYRFHSIVGETMERRDIGNFLRITLDIYVIFSSNIDPIELAASLNRNDKLNDKRFIISPIIKKREEDPEDFPPHFMYLDVHIISTSGEEIMKSVRSLYENTFIQRIINLSRNVKKRIQVIQSKVDPKQEKLDSLIQEGKTLDALKKKIRDNSGEIQPDEHTLSVFVLGNLFINQTKTLLVAGFDGFSSMLPERSNISEAVHGSLFIGNFDTNQRQESMWMILLDRLKMDLGGYSRNDMKDLLLAVGCTIRKEDDVAFDTLTVSLPFLEIGDLWTESNFKRIDEDQIIEEIHFRIRKQVGIFDIPMDHVEYLEPIRKIQEGITERYPQQEFVIHIDLESPVSTQDHVDAFIRHLGDYREIILQHVGEFMEVTESISETLPFDVSKFVVMTKRKKGRKQKILEMIKEHLPYTLLLKKCEEILSDSTDIYDEQHFLEYIEEFKEKVSSLSNEFLEMIEETGNIVAAKIMSEIMSNLKKFCKIHLHKGDSFYARSRVMNCSISQEYLEETFEMHKIFSYSYWKINSELLDPSILIHSSDPINIINAKISRRESDMHEKVFRSRCVLDGYNLLDLLSIDDVDGSTSYTDDLHTTYDLFGIEGVRTVIIRSFSYLSMMNNIRVDPRHIYLIADLMTYHGELLPLAPSDVDFPFSSVMKQALFRKPNKVLMDAIKEERQEEGIGMGEFLGAPVGDLPLRQEIQEILPELYRRYGKPPVEILTGTVVPTEELQEEVEEAFLESEYFSPRTVGREGEEYTYEDKLEDLDMILENVDLEMHAFLESQYTGSILE